MHPVRPLGERDLELERTRLVDHARAAREVQHAHRAPAAVRIGEIRAQAYDVAEQRRVRVGEVPQCAAIARQPTLERVRVRDPLPHRHTEQAGEHRIRVPHVPPAAVEQRRDEAIVRGAPRAAHRTGQHRARAGRGRARHRERRLQRLLRDVREPPQQRTLEIDHRCLGPAVRHRARIRPGRCLAVRAAETA